jgi:predicted 2-oxoglutarate/Fe(II)-dependent dioxygenase YbiX
MKLHCDHIHDIFDGTRKGIPIMTLVGVLNDDYEGGDFLMWEKEKISIPTGSVLVFPSNFMYPHEVTSIKTGSRYSFVSWVF